MTLAPPRGFRRFAVSADGGTRNPGAFEGSLIQEDAILSHQSQFKKGA
jgi:hypothetical protein